MRLLPIDLIEGLLKGLREGVLTLNTIGSKETRWGDGGLVHSLGLEYDPYTFAYEANLRAICEFLIETPPDSSQNLFSIKDFVSSARSANYQISPELAHRFVSSLVAKRFLILTGLSGSGKTQLARVFARWISQDAREQICVLPVGADWTNSERLLGYPNALKKDEYVDTEVLRLILRAQKDSEDGGGSKPYFLILDEMNLSHVERYFSDFLSAMESDEPIPLHNEDAICDLEDDEGRVPKSVRIPPNLFIIGTVNIDETTYMFSPKVLDRANVIEFRVDERELKEFLADPRKLELEKLEKLGSGAAASFMEAVRSNEAVADGKGEVNDILEKFFIELKKVGAEFGFRTASDIKRFCAAGTVFDGTVSTDRLIDMAVLQKLLPKLHGSRKLEERLQAMARLCLKDGADFDLTYLDERATWPEKENVRFPLTLEKLGRMHRALMQNGFTSFAEA